ncbi:MAG TPA: prepilin-type N-terminal cleavage/methylation domain-containing protein [Burkholderiaceae bacterium]|jgi:general secretion pathway protein J
MKRGRAGFTLIELLVAIAVLALIAVMGWRGLDVILRARSSISAETEKTKVHQITFSQIQLDCSLLVRPNALPGMETIFTDHNRLVFIRYVYVENEAPRLAVVGYRIKDGALIRTVSNSTRDRSILQTNWNAILSDSSGMSSTTLVSDIAAMSIRTWNSREGNWRVAGTAVGASPHASRRPIRGFEGINGIEINLLVNGQTDPMWRIFFLGAG